MRTIECVQALEHIVRARTHENVFMNQWINSMTMYIMEFSLDLISSPPTCNSGTRRTMHIYFLTHPVHVTKHTLLLFFISYSKWSNGETHTHNHIYIHIHSQQEELIAWHRFYHLFGLMSDSFFFAS